MRGKDLSENSIQRPDAKYWPEGQNTVEVTCPWCGQSTSTFIGLVKEMRAPGRDDDCEFCGRIIIVEAFEHGIVAVQTESISIDQALAHLADYQ